MTTVYLIRHSIRFDKSKIKNRNSKETIQDIAEKDILSIEGEKRAKYLTKIEELNHLDAIYTSTCPRTLQTAKYLMDEQNLQVTIDERIDERKVGKSNADKYPNWFQLQYLDENFKTIGGESQKDVRERAESFINEVLEEYKDRRVAVFTHGYVITFYLKKWLEFVDVTNEQRITFKYKGKLFFDRKLDAPEIFKLEFDENKNLINIENIMINYIEK